MTLGELAATLGCPLVGAAPGAERQTITRVNTLDDAGPGDVTFLTNAKFASKVATTRASAIIADGSLTGAPCPILSTAEPSVVLATAIGVLTPAAVPVTSGVHPLASVDATATLGAGVSVGPFAVVSAGALIGARTVLHPHAVVGAHTHVGDDCVFHSHASVRDRITIGHRVTLQNGAVVGSEGFGFATRADGTHQKIPQVGIVVIGDDVEIGANSTVDRPAIGETRIGSGTKIDNLVHIAHGVKIGKNVRLAALVGIAGSSVIEDDVVLAGQVGVINHVRVGAGAQVASKSAVMFDLEGGHTYAGIPAVPIGQWRRWAVQFRKGGKGPL
jgi:UDP-3-O-[3-hydroxymyristoyl] glucosamine N-acyltransferase